MIPSIEGAISIPTHIWPSSVRISPDKPEPQPTSRIKAGISALALETEVNQDYGKSRRSIALKV